VTGKKYRYNPNPMLEQIPAIKRIIVKNHPKAQRNRKNGGLLPGVNWSLASAGDRRGGTSLPDS
jgi:hypothetical protein